MATTMPTEIALLNLLQLASPALPLGAYCYSEGLEYLCQQEITNAQQLTHWLTQELGYGAIRIEAALMLRGYRYAQDLERLEYWNHWLTAHKETKELRQQSAQMGKSLLDLMLNLTPNPVLQRMKQQRQTAIHYALIFGVAAAHGQVPLESALLAFLQSWASNLIIAGVKLIPLGQTAGQQVLMNTHQVIVQVSPSILNLADDQLYCCSLGLGLASMNHESQYSRLFRS
jgi:urease accessory protein